MSLIVLCTDDEPDDEGSPQHYVLIHGILTSQVIYHLCEIGINVDAIISVKAQSYDRFLPKSETVAEREPGVTEGVRIQTEANDPLAY